MSVCCNWPAKLCLLELRDQYTLRRGLWRMKRNQVIAELNMKTDCLPRRQQQGVHIDTGKKTATCIHCCKTASSYRKASHSQQRTTSSRIEPVVYKGCKPQTAQEGKHWDHSVSCYAVRSWLESCKIQHFKKAPENHTAFTFNFKIEILKT